MRDDLTLLVDCDGVVINSNPILDEMMASINFCCSKEYVEMMKQQHDKREEALLNRYFENDPELFYKYQMLEQKNYERLLKINRITKDEVLEELYPAYKNRINYFMVYTLTNYFQGVIERIKFFNKGHFFKKIYIATQYNSVMEVLAKHLTFKESLPGIEVVFVPFHDKDKTPYLYDKRKYFENGDRKPVNKIKYLVDYLGLNPKKLVVIDDTLRVCHEAEELGAKAIFRDKNCQDPLKAFDEAFDYRMGYTDEDAWREAMKDEKVLRLLRD